MLFKLTERCSRGCSHCMEDALPEGADMPVTLFHEALEFSARMESAAWALGAPPLVLLSGGECTDHPQLEAMITEVLRRRWLPILITHGAWLADPDRRRSLLRAEWPTLGIQVTHVPRYYPGPAPHRIDDPRVVYVEELQRLLPIGRAKRPRVAEQWVDQPYSAPSSFNLRSATRSTGSFAEAVSLLRLRRASGSLSGLCTPSVSADGVVRVGESRNCYAVGTVRSSDLELTANTLAMGECNRCGLEKGIAPELRRAIGLSHDGSRG